MTLTCAHDSYFPVFHEQTASHDATLSICPFVRPSIRPLAKKNHHIPRPDDLALLNLWVMLFYFHTDTTGRSIFGLKHGTLVETSTNFSLFPSHPFICVIPTHPSMIAKDKKTLLKCHSTWYLHLITAFLLGNSNSCPCCSIYDGYIYIYIYINIYMCVCLCVCEIYIWNGQWFKKVTIKSAQYAHARMITTIIWVQLKSCLRPHGFVDDHKLSTCWSGLDLCFFI